MTTWFQRAWRLYGKGWKGTNGVPRFEPLGEPVLGTTMDLGIGNSAGVNTSAAMFLGTSQVNLPTPFGGSLPVKPIVIVNLKLTPLGVRYPIKIPADPRLCGAIVYGQVWELDRGASRGLSCSAGLEPRFGS